MRFWKYYEFEDFTIECDKIRCPRNTLYHPVQCLTDYKRKNCFNLYNRKLERDIEKIKQDQKDERWELVKQLVKENVGEGCHLFKCLDAKDKSTVLQDGLLNHNDFKKIDGAHILPKGPWPQHKYKTSNVILIKRLFHTRLESYNHPITEEFIGREAAQQWYLKIWNYVHKKDLTWEQLEDLIVEEESAKLEEETNEIS